ncbi:MAG: 23S rRNA (pseudouridine(1915)-N(3))-methyltransferase RlmH [Candidatus Caccovivens sp.]
MTINIICVGNLKEKFSRDEQDEYIKRLSAFCKINIVELKEQNQLENINLIVEKEGEDIVKRLKGYSILCDIKGSEISSEKFAQKIQNLMQENSTLNFVIGGSYGVSQKVTALANERISFSPMTFPHNLFRIMLLEQIYRAFTILNGKSYHK